MTMQVLRIPLGRGDLDPCDSSQIILVIKTITQHVSKIAQRALHSIRSRLLLRLLKSRRFTLTILNMTVTYILVENSIFQGHSADDRKTQANFARGALVDEVDLYGFDFAAPAVETEYFVGKIDDFFGGEVVYLSASGAGTCRYVFWT